MNNNIINALFTLFLFISTKLYFLFIYDYKEISILIEIISKSIDSKNSTDFQRKLLNHNVDLENHTHLFKFIKYTIFFFFLSKEDKHIMNRIKKRIKRCKQLKIKEMALLLNIEAKAELQNRNYLVIGILILISISTNYIVIDYFNSSFSNLYIFGLILSSYVSSVLCIALSVYLEKDIQRLLNLLEANRLLNYVKVHPSVLNED